MALFESCIDRNVINGCNHEVGVYKLEKIRYHRIVIGVYLFPWDWTYLILHPFNEFMVAVSQSKIPLSEVSAIGELCSIYFIESECMQYL